MSKLKWRRILLIVLGVMMMFAKPVLAKKSISKAKTQIAQIRANFRHSMPRSSNSIGKVPRISGPRISIKSNIMSHPRILKRSESRISRSFRMPKVISPSRSMPSRSIKDFRNSARATEYSQK